MIVRRGVDALGVGPYIPPLQMTRFLIAFLALLGLAAQAPACARVAMARPEVGCVAAQRTVCRVGGAVVSGQTARIVARAASPAATLPAGPVRPALVTASPVLPGIDRAHE